MVKKAVGIAVIGAGSIKANRKHVYRTLWSAESSIQGISYIQNNILGGVKDGVPDSDG